MPNNNRRGKWQPFDALSGFRDSLQKKSYDLEKQVKPQLSPDQVEDINNILNEALTYQQEVEVNYFSDGYIETITGGINKIDLIKKLIYINNKKIRLDSIVDCKLR